MPRKKMKEKKNSLMGPKNMNAYPDMLDPEVLSCISNPDQIIVNKLPSMEHPKYPFHPLPLPKVVPSTLLFRSTCLRGPHLEYLIEIYVKKLSLAFFCMKYIPADPPPITIKSYLSRKSSLATSIGLVSGSISSY